MTVEIGEATADRSTGTSQEMDAAGAIIVDRIAEAVVRKLDERRQIDVIAQAVILKMSDRTML